MILFATVFAANDYSYDFNIISADSLISELQEDFAGCYIRAIDLPKDCEQFWTQFDSDIDDMPIHTKLHIFFNEEDAKNSGGCIFVWVFTNDGWVAYDHDEYYELESDVSQLVGNEVKQVI